MKLLIVGYYDHNNLGDDMFKDSFKKLLPQCDLNFVDIMTIYDQINYKEYDRIICGGGDIVNDYFLNKIKYISENFDKPIYEILQETVNIQIQLHFYFIFIFYFY